MTAIAMIIAPEEFQDKEYSIPKQIFKDEGFSVATFSTRRGEVTGTNNATADADQSLEEMDPSLFQAVFLVGGNGARIFFDDKILHDHLRTFAGSGKVTAAICISPNTLANAGLLEGRQATCVPDEEIIENLASKGAKYTGLAVTIDLPIVTASGPAAAGECAREIVNILKDSEEKK